MANPNVIVTSLHGREIGLDADKALVLRHGISGPSDQTISAKCWHTGANPAMASTDGTDATPVTTETYIAEVFVGARCDITGIALFNGSVAAGNVFVALADSQGNIVASSGAVTMAGTDAYQRVPLSATVKVKGPATYFVLAQYSSVSARYNTHTLGSFGAAKKTGETNGTFTTITPPTTFTTALGPIATLY